MVGTTSLWSHPLVRIARQEIMERTPLHISYHTIEHTDMVITQVIHLAVSAGLETRPEVELLVIAAAFHDIGYIHIAKGHEELGAQRVQDEMARAGYDTHSQAMVAAWIMDTCVHVVDGLLQQVAPRTFWSRYLQDADLSQFTPPWDEFMRLQDLVRRDLPPEGAEVYYRRTLEFMRGHHWRTLAANRLYGPTTSSNINRLEEYIAETCL